VLARNNAASITSSSTRLSCFFCAASLSRSAVAYSFRMSSMNASAAFGFLCSRFNIHRAPPDGADPQSTSPSPKSAFR
jgi:hypothetical protein